MRHYELVVVLSPMLNQEQVSSTWGRIKDFISTRSGDITYEEQWGTRRLAYPIRKGSYQFLEGSYHLTRFSVEKSINQELHTFLRVDDQVLRSLVVAALPPGIEPETPAQKRAAAAEIAAAAAAARAAAAALEAENAPAVAETQAAEAVATDESAAAPAEETTPVAAQEAEVAVAEQPAVVAAEAAEPEAAEATVEEPTEEPIEDPAPEVAATENLEAKDETEA